MCVYRHAGTHILALSALVLALVAIVPVAPATPAKAAPQVVNPAPVEQSKVILGDTSIDAPALWTRDPKSPSVGLTSVLAWTGTDAGHSLNMMKSGDGVTYGGKTTFAESSATRPAVAAQGTPLTIVLAWTGTNTNHSLNLLCQGLACGVSGNGYKKVTLSDSSFASPALARFGSGYLLTWAGNDANHSLNILRFSLTASGSGFLLGAKTTLWQFGGIATPSLNQNLQNGQLLLTWAARSPVGQLMFATSSDGVSWSAAQALSETSASSPAGFVATTASMPAYWMAWAGAGGSLNVRFTQSFPQWPSSDKAILGDTALGGPVLGYIGDVGQMLLAWTGTDSAHHMNIATIITPIVATLDQRIDTYIAGLSTAQLIGQTLMMSVCTSSYNTNIDQALKQWFVGSAIIYTSCNGGPTEPPTAAGLRSLDQTMQSNANRSGTLLIGIDEEGGTVDRLAPYYGSTPSARQLANTGNPLNAYAQAQTDAGRMSYLGLNADFAPVVDVDQGGGEGPSRMFGTTVSVVTTYAGAFLNGLQQNGVSGTLKHWPGLGAATGNPDNTLPTINQTQAQMIAIDFAPFRSLLYQAPGMIMVTTVMAPAFDTRNPAMLSSTLVAGQLRGKLGYRGVIITDALGAQGLIDYMKQQGYTDPVQGIAEASVRAFVAGDDLLLCPLSQNELAAIVTAMGKAVASGRISQTRLHDALHRIIRLKVDLGLITLS